MNSEKIRIRVAEACGWKPGEDDRMRDGTYRWDVRRNGTIFGSKPMTYLDSDEFCGSYLCDQRVPDYPNDLNACAEFERTLTQDERITYKRFLYLIVLDDPGNLDNDTTFAMARQRCEAFLRTKGLWEEES